MSDNEPKLPPFAFDMEQMRKDAIRIYADAIHQMGGDPVQRSYVDALTQRLAAAEARAAAAEAREERLAETVRAYIKAKGSSGSSIDEVMRRYNDLEKIALAATSTDEGGERQ